MWHFPGLRKVRQRNFCCAVNRPREGHLDASRRRGVADSDFFLLWRPFYGGLWRRLSGDPGIAAGFAMADDASATKTRRQWRQPKMSENQSMPVARPVPGAAAGGPRRPPGQAWRRSCAPRISSDPVRVWRASCCDAESNASKLSSSWPRTLSAARTAANHLTHAGTESRNYWNDHSGRRGNSVARRRGELAERPLADGA